MNVDGHDGDDKTVETAAATDDGGAEAEGEAKSSIAILTA